MPQWVLLCARAAKSQARSPKTRARKTSAAPNLPPANRPQPYQDRAQSLCGTSPLSLTVRTCRLPKPRSDGVLGLQLSTVNHGRDCPATVKLSQKWDNRHRSEVKVIQVKLSLLWYSYQLGGGVARGAVGLNLGSAGCRRPWGRAANGSCDYSTDRGAEATTKPRARNPRTWSDARGSKHHRHRSPLRPP